MEVELEPPTLPPCRIIQQGWMRAAYDDHGMAGLAVSPTDPSRPVPLSWVLQGVEQVLEQALKSSEVLQEQEEA